MEIKMEMEKGPRKLAPSRVTLYLLVVGVIFFLLWGATLAIDPPQSLAIELLAQWKHALFLTGTMLVTTSTWRWF